MADFYTIKPEVAVSASGTQLRERQHDNGDGTSSPAVWIDSTTISGPVTISGEVEIKNDAGNPLPTALTAAQITVLTPPPAITNYASETGGNLAAIKLNSDKPQFDINNRLITTLGTTSAGEDLVANTQGVTQKPVVSPTYSPSFFASFGTSTALSAKAATGQLKSVYASNTNAAIRYLQIHNKASAPAAGDTAILSFIILANNATTIGAEFLGGGGLYLSNGVSVAVSSTAGTYTAPTATDHIINGTYV